MENTEGIWECRGCHTQYGEYINGCPNCWDDDLSVEENHKKYPDRKVVLQVSPPLPTK